MKLVCIRHLPTEWNQLGLLQGRRDIDIAPPNEVAWQTIAENKAQLDGYGPFAHVFVSSLKRTQQTAVFYNFHKATVEPLLDEIDFGPYEGQPKTSLLQDWGDQWQQDPRALIFGEPLANLEARIKTFLTKYDTCSQLLLFGHGGWIRGLLSIIQYGDIRSMNQFVVKNNHLYELILSKGHNAHGIFEATYPHAKAKEVRSN